MFAAFFNLFNHQSASNVQNLNLLSNKKTIISSEVVADTTRLNILKNSVVSINNNECISKINLDDKIMKVSQINSDLLSSNNKIEAVETNNKISSQIVADTNGSNVLEKNIVSASNKCINKITLEEKIMIASQINSGSKCSNELAKYYNITTARVYYFARKIRLGKNIRLVSGRPRALDNKSEQSISTLLNSSSFTGKTLVDRRKILRKEIRAQIKLSSLRRLKQATFDFVPKVWNRTLDRYVQKYLPSKQSISTP